jgi:HAD superfamily hydrolase (TIGR01509 family)
MPHVHEVLAQLRCRACVASSSTPERLRHSLALAGLLEHFGASVFSASQVQRGKPAPDLFLFAAQSMDAAPERCLVIEDSVAGVEAGLAAGMIVSGFVGGSHCTPGHADQLSAAGASEVLAEMRELLPMLQRQRSA